MYLQNLHTHTCYCDGIDTPEEIIVSAIEKGIKSIGFSGHSYMKYSPMFVMQGCTRCPKRSRVCNSYR